MKPQFTDILCGFLLILLPFAAISQPAIEFANGSGPAGNGSVLNNQVITFQSNVLNPATGSYAPLLPTTTATFTISNQQYTLTPTENPNLGDVSFGANVNATGKTPTPMAVFSAMNTISAAPANDFSSTQDNINAGISVTSNYAVEMFTSAMGLYNANLSTSGTYYMADLTINFNVAISNPVIHIVGIGCVFGALGMTTSLELGTPGVTLTELSGSPELSVTPTSINNSAAIPTSTTGSGAASGSILVNGTVSSLLFHLYLRGDGKTPTWSNANEHTGDAWMIGISALNTFTLLPMNMTAFTAEPQNHSVDLQWTTATQQNSNYFSVQRSQDGANWTAIGQVAAGNSESQLQYNYVDRQPLTGATYYRLQEVADDGSSVYSPIRDVNFSATAITTSWYPNPTHDRLTITSNGNLQSLTLTTIDGRILQAFDGIASGQSSLDLSRYPFGIYFLVIRTPDGQSSVAKIERN